jgi:hypothetical protein
MTTYAKLEDYRCCAKAKFARCICCIGTFSCPDHGFTHIRKVLEKKYAPVLAALEWINMVEGPLWPSGKI